MKKFILAVVLFLGSMSMHAYSGYYQIIQSSSSNNPVGKYLYVGMQGEGIIAGLFDEVYFLKRSDNIANTRVKANADYIALRYNQENLHFFKNGNKYQPINSNYSIVIEWQTQDMLSKLLGRGRRANCTLAYKGKYVCRFQIEGKENYDGGRLADFSDFLSYSDNSYPFKTYYTTIPARYHSKPAQTNSWMSYTPKSKSVIIAVDTDEKRAYVVGIADPHDPTPGSPSSLFTRDPYYALEYPVSLPITGVGRIYTLARYVGNSYTQEITIEEYEFSLSPNLFDLIPGDAIYWWNSSNYRTASNFNLN